MLCNILHEAEHHGSSQNRLSSDRKDTADKFKYTHCGHCGHCACWKMWAEGGRRLINPRRKYCSTVCVCVFSSHSFWTSSSLDVPAGVTQEEGHTGFLIHLLSAVHALIFLARRIQPFLSLVDREVEFFYNRSTVHQSPYHVAYLRFRIRAY